MPWTSGAIVPFVDHGHDLGRGGGSGQAPRLVKEAELLAGPGLAAHVDGGGGIVAHEQHPQPRRDPLLAQPGRLPADLFLDLGRHLRSVQDPRAHGGPILARIIHEAAWPSE